MFAERFHSLRFAEDASILADPEKTGREVAAENDVLQIRKDVNLPFRAVATSIRTVNNLRQSLGESDYIFVISSSHKDNQVSISSDIYNELTKHLSKMAN